MPDTEPERKKLFENILLAIEGDHDAWLQLYELYRPFLMSWVRAESVPPDLSYRDLVQDAWLKIYEGLDGFRGCDNEAELPAVFFSWVRQVAKHTYKNKLVASSRKKRLPNNANVYPGHESVADQKIETPSAIVSVDEQRRKILLALERLPKIADRELVEMTVWERHSLRSISIVLGQEYSGLRRRYHRILKQLQADFESSNS